jgi:hypothetical protein
MALPQLPQINIIKKLIESSTGFLTEHSLSALIRFTLKKRNDSPNNLDLTPAGNIFGIIVQD